MDKKHEMMRSEIEGVTWILYRRVWSYKTKLFEDLLLVYVKDGVEHAYRKLTDEQALAALTRD